MPWRVPMPPNFSTNWCFSICCLAKSAMLVPFVGRPFGLPDVPLIQRAIALLKPIHRNKLRGIFKRSFHPCASSCLSLVFNQSLIDFRAPRMCTR
jgi:hypothetical protein